MPTNPYRDLAQALKITAVKAGRAILDIYETDFQVTVKKDNSPVTDADQRAEDIILEDLARLAPDIPVLAEEAASAGGTMETGTKFFLVDPLDGTREFVNRNGEFTVNVALIENTVPVVGVVLAPACNRLFMAAGADHCYEFSNTNGELEEIVNSTPRKLTSNPPAPDGLRVVASRSHRDRQTEQFLEKFTVKEIVGAGSSLKFCLLAADEADFYPRLGRTMEWDTAAGQAVLESAGGVVTDLDGVPLRYGKRDRGYDNPAFLAWGKEPAT